MSRTSGDVFVFFFFFEADIGGLMERLSQSMFLSVNISENYKMPSVF